MKDQPELEFLLMIHRPRRTVKRLVKNQWGNLKRNGWRWIPYQTGEILEMIAENLRKPLWFSTPRPGQEFHMDALEKDPRVQISVFRSIHSREAIDAVRTFAPDLGIALAAPILKPLLFGAPALGTINLHKGKVPQYRGMPPAFWELWNDEKSVGCTVHFVVEKLDSGDVIATDSIQRDEFSTAHGLRLTLDELGVRMVCEVARLFRSGEVPRSTQTEAGTTYRKPTLAQVAALERRLPSGRPAAGIRGVIRSAAAAGYVHGLRPVARLRNRLAKTSEIVVLLYHRVSDEFRDGVTVGIEQFDQHMAYLAKRYPIASIDDVAAGRVPKTRDGKPVIAVTFDDGYRDNYENAVPILLRHRVPASFFVSTGMIGRDVGFKHDLTKLGRALPNMDWDQLREMRDMGFLIGSHTVSHLNCAKADEIQLKQELADSKKALELELGLEDVLFAYPFGGRSDMTPDALALVKSAGYSACLSAYGGVNRGPVSRYDILRMPVSSGFDFGRFAARVEGW